jgi:hypothetical protein
MSDIELEKAEKKDGGGMLRGKDSKPSLRRWTGLGLIFGGVGFLAWAMSLTADILKISSWVAIVPVIPGVFLIMAGLFCYQLFTAQNITDIVGKAKDK